MYGKVFRSIYDGTLREHWQALVTFQQMIVLADADGIVDMTAQAIHHRTGIPLDIITEGLAHLAQPDPDSRSPEHGGRRIMLLDPNRSWGWFLVNWEVYRDRRDPDEVRAANRERKQRQRERQCGHAESRAVTPGHAKSRAVTPGHAKSRHTDTYTDTDKDKDKDKDDGAVAPSGDAYRLPLSGSGYWTPTDAMLRQWCDTFGDPLVTQELRAMQAWLLANPGRRKTARGMPRFAVGWFNRTRAANREHDKRPKHRQRADDDYAAANRVGGGE